MKITENNYEEYFLLYIDDELTGPERNAVEAFVAEYPQYTALLESLRQAKLSINESIGFTHKNVLYKTENNEIGISNYEDYFLLYTDDELSEADKESTERFVLQHPQLQTEFMLLQQTKLPLEKVEFTGKEILYKKEKKRRIIPLYVTRMAIAAVMITLIVLGWQLSSTRNNSVATTIKSAQPKQQIVKPATTAEQPKDAANNTEQKQAIVQETGAKHKTKGPLDVSSKKEQFAAAANNKNNSEKTPVIAVEQPGQHDISTTPETTEIVVQKQTAVETAKQSEVLKPLELVNTDETNAQTASSLLSDNNIAQPAVYKELNTDDDNHTLYVGAFQLNKTKVNGFLKSASRLLGSRAKGTTE